MTVLPYVRVVLSVAFATFVGYAIVKTFYTRPGQTRSSAELMGLSLALGSAVLPAAMILLSSLAVPFSLPAVAAPLFVGAAVLLLVGKRSPLETSSSGTGQGGLHYQFKCHRTLPGLFSLCLVGSIIIVVFAGSMLEPIAEADALGGWSYHAKVFYYERTAFPASMIRGEAGRAVAHWPPFYPLMQTWTHIAMGAYDDHALKLLPPFLYAGLLAVVYGMLRRYLSSSYSLALLILLAGIPAIVVPFPEGSVASGYADVPIALFFAAAASMLILWMTSRKLGHILLGAVFCAGAIWMKREGLAFASILTVATWAFVVALKRRRHRVSLTHPIVFTVIQVAAYALLIRYKFRFPGGLGWGAINYGTMSATEIIGRFLKFTGFMVLEAFNPTRWGILWILLAALVILRHKHLRKHIVAFPILLIPCHVFCALSYMAVSGYRIGHHVHGDIHRVLIQIAPIAVMGVGLLSSISDEE